MVPLVTMDNVRKHVKRTDTMEDDDLLRKILQAQAIVLRYLSDTTNAAWTATIASWTPETLEAEWADVQAAIFCEIAFLNRYRGDEPDETKSEHGELAPGVKACLYRIRAPVIA